MTMNVINAVAEFERDFLIERSQAGHARAKVQGKPLGRSSAHSADQQPTGSAACLLFWVQHVA